MSLPSSDNYLPLIVIRAWLKDYHNTISVLMFSVITQLQGEGPQITKIDQN